MSDDRGMDQNDWTAELLKDAVNIRLDNGYYLYKVTDKWLAGKMGSPHKVFTRGFKNPADAYQRLIETIANDIRP